MVSVRGALDRGHPPAGCPANPDKVLGNSRRKCTFRGNFSLDVLADPVDDRASRSYFIYLSRDIEVRGAAREKSHRLLMHVSCRSFFTPLAAEFPKRRNAGGEAAFPRGG